MDDTKTGPDIGPDNEIGSEEDIKQNLSPSQGERTEQTGRVGVEAAKPFGGEFPQAAPSVKEQSPRPTSVNEVIPPEKPSQEEQAIPVKAVDAAISLNPMIDDMKSKGEENLGQTAAIAVDARVKAMRNIE